MWADSRTTYQSFSSVQELDEEVLFVFRALDAKYRSNDFAVELDVLFALFGRRPRYVNLYSRVGGRRFSRIAMLDQGWAIKLALTGIFWGGVVGSRQQVRRDQRVVDGFERRGKLHPKDVVFVHRGRVDACAPIVEGQTRWVSWS